MRGIVRNRRLGAIVVGCGLALAIVIGAFAVFTEAQAAGRCICPMVYSPVVCDNGKTYPNLCVAQCKHAKNCVPVFIVPPPI